MNEERIYRCPVCAKPFDRDDKLVDFAIASHEKGHDAPRTASANLIHFDGSGSWRCVLCAHDLGRYELSAQLAVVGHAREIHGSPSASPLPDETREGRSRRRGTRAGSSDGLADVVGDLAGSVIESAAEFFRAFTGGQ